MEGNNASPTKGPRRRIALGVSCALVLAGCAVLRQPPKPSGSDLVTAHGDNAAHDAAIAVTALNPLDLRNRRSRRAAT